MELKLFHGYHTDFCIVYSTLYRFWHTWVSVVIKIPVTFSVTCCIHNKFCRGILQRYGTGVALYFSYYVEHIIGVENCSFCRFCLMQCLKNAMFGLK